ncbi:MAG: DNA-binding protein, partial [Bacteroidetes bacterium HGW-Bacteroidetes-21]
MARSQESFNKKEVRAKKEKKRKDKAAKRLDKRENTSKGGMDDMIAYVDENGMLTSTPPDPNKKKVVKAENIEISIQKRDDSLIMDPVRKGILTFYNDTKGFGFIKDTETH